MRRLPPSETPTTLVTFSILIARFAVKPLGTMITSADAVMNSITTRLTLPFTAKTLPPAKNSISASPVTVFGTEICSAIAPFTYTCGSQPTWIARSPVIWSFILKKVALALIWNALSVIVTIARPCAAETPLEPATSIPA